MTTEEFIDYCDSLNETAQFKDYLLSTKQFERTKFLMKKYAELKCKELLEIVAEKAEMYKYNNGWRQSKANIKEVDCFNYKAAIDKDSILNAYPLQNIK